MHYIDQIVFIFLMYMFCIQFCQQLTTINTHCSHRSLPMFPCLCGPISISFFPSRSCLL